MQHYKGFQRKDCESNISFDSSEKEGYQGENLPESKPEQTQSHSQSYTKTQPQMSSQMQSNKLPTEDDYKFYQEALNEAKKGLSENGIPIGAVLVHKGQVIGRGHDRRIQNGSAIRHGEIDCLENCGRQKPEVYRECTMYGTLSPCSMCAGADVLFRIPRVVIGENQNFKGDEEFLRSRGIEVIVLNDKETIDMLRGFIENNHELCEDIWATCAKMTS